MANAGSVVIKIDGDDSRYRKVLSGLGKAATAAVKGLTIAGTVLSAAWGAVGLTSVKYNAQIEQLETSFKTMTGSAEKATKIMERLRKLGASTPFSTEDLAEATQLLMQYGMDADTAIDRMSMLGDIAQGNAEKMMSIATAYGQMTSAGKVQLQDIKQMINAGFNPLLEISERTGESMESLYDRISKGTMAVEEITNAMRSATSEGGKFFQSMQQQSETVSGLISTLKDELQTLGGDIFKPVSESLRTQLLPEAIRLVREMQDAYGKRGIDGLIDSVTNEIPKLLDAASKALEKVAAKLKDKLPGIIKKIISALPKLLASAGDSIIPTIVDTIFEVIAVAVEEVVGRLPELVPILLRGIGNLIKSVLMGLVNVADGLFDGISKALKELGALGMTPMEAFEQAWENTDTSQYKNIDVTVGVTITPEEYEEKIDAALAEVRTALENAPGLTEEQRNTIETAIINGTGIQLMNDTLANLDIPEGKAEELTDAITSAAETIDTTLAGLGLSDGAIANVEAIAASGGNVKKALEEDYNIDPAKASEAAGKITTAMDSIETAASSIGLDETTVNVLQAAAVSDKAAIEAALLLMGVDPSVITPVTDSYDTISGSLTASAKSIFNQIYEEFSNGVPETDEDVKAAEDAVKGLFKDAYEKVDKWKQAAIQEAEASGLTGNALADAVLAIEEEADGMVAELNRMEQESIAWTNENANKSTMFVKGNLDQLDSIVAQLSDINARIDVLTNEQFDNERAVRELVKAGAVTNVEDQIKAFAITEAEMAQRIEEAKGKAGAALEEAVEQFKGDAEGYSAREKEILDQLAKDKEAAYEIYNSQTEQIIAGIVKATPQLADALDAYNAEQQAKDMAAKLQQMIVDAANKGTATGERIDMSTFVDNLTAEGVDLTTIAEKLGISPEELNTQIADALKTDAGDTMLNTALVDYVGKVESDLSTALQNAGIDESALPAIKTAVEEGYLTAAGDVDWTKFETVLGTMLEGSVGNVDVSDDTQTVGNELDNGVIAGIKENKGAVVEAARQMIRAAITGMRKEAEIASPSKVTKRLGAFFGQGFALGIENEAQHAAESARRMAENAIRAIDGIGGRLTVSQQVNAGGMASAFQTMLAGMNLATDSDTPIQIYINGRLVSETMRHDIRATQASFNDALAMGVGK